MISLGKQSAWFVFVALVVLPGHACAEIAVPRAHARPPGPPLEPDEALAKMVVPRGFQVELVAAEPDIVNPVAACVDEKGRFWVTESFEYPRSEPGPGRDRIKVLEDTDGDGRVDRVTIFAEGLNIPSGIAVGYGGVWVVNAPDLLLLRDVDGDLKADEQHVIVTGFGRTDVHELPNSLTWGPDGWLYGLNGVFNNSHVVYPPDNPHYSADHAGWSFTCALWRIHPTTREFELYCEGTSNPWGLAINAEGDFFVSACVLDHLWHLVESAYYLRQGGPYPPHTWPLPSIVEHSHQQAAYCGAAWFDTSGYPAEFRQMLLMGNIHGACINADRIVREGATYHGTAHPGFAPPDNAWRQDEHEVIRKTGDPAAPRLADFLSANDPWFMPVAQFTGPDGHLYVLDWYDRYHCYQDARADPEGIERERGRLYRVRYGDKAAHPPRDLGSLGDVQLVELLLRGPSEYHRDTARRLLGERFSTKGSQGNAVSLLKKLVHNSAAPGIERLRGAWALACGQQLDAETLVALGIQRQSDAEYAVALDAWQVRWMGERTDWDWERWKTELARHIAADSEGARRPVLLQIAIALGKQAERLSKNSATTRQEILHALFALGGRCRDDVVLPAVVWQNAFPMVSQFPEAGYQVLHEMLQSSVRLGEQDDDRQAELLAVRELYAGPLLDVLFDSPKAKGELFGRMVECLLTSDVIASADRDRLGLLLTQRILDGVLSDEEQRILRTTFTSAPRANENAASLEMAQIAVALQAASRQDIAQVTAAALDGESDGDKRLMAFQSLVYGNATAAARQVVVDWLDRESNDVEQLRDFRRSLALAWAKSSGSEVAEELSARLATADETLRPTIVEVLSQRASWSLALLSAIESGAISRHELNFHQMQRLATSSDAQVRGAAEKALGRIRVESRQDRQQAIAEVKELVASMPGDPRRGVQPFQRLCGACHTIYGAGADVGPDLTRNGRGNWDQLLQNVLDPSLVIGPAFQARVLITNGGRSLTGVPIEESESRVVLKIQGGKIESIPRDEIDEYRVSDVSLMPDGVEQQLSQQELVDLLQFLALDRQPEEADAKWISGTPNFPAP